MGTSPRKALLKIDDVAYNRVFGVLYVLPEKLAWTHGGKELLSLKYSEVNKINVSPEGTLKVYLQIINDDSSEYTLEFFNQKGAAFQVKDRDKVADMVVKFFIEINNRRKLDEEAKTDQLLLDQNPHLHTLYKDLVLSKVVPRNEFWAHYGKHHITNPVELNNVQTTGVSSGFLSDIKPVREADGVKYCTTTTDDIAAIDKVHPAVKVKHTESVPGRMSDERLEDREIKKMTESIVPLVESEEELSPPTKSSDNIGGKIRYTMALKWSTTNISIELQMDDCEDLGDGEVKKRRTVVELNLLRGNVNGVIVIPDQNTEIVKPEEVAKTTQAMQMHDCLNDWYGSAHRFVDNSIPGIISKELTTEGNIIANTIEEKLTPEEVELQEAYFALTELLRIFYSTFSTTSLPININEEEVTAAYMSIQKFEVKEANRLDAKHSLMTFEGKPLDHLKALLCAAKERYELNRSTTDNSKQE